VTALADAASAVCVLDIEASGFGRGSYPIEIGFVLPGGQAYCTLIRPTERWTHWDGDAQALHGITQQQLQLHGRSAIKVAQTLNQQLAGSTVYCDGWAHDYTWLNALFEEAACSPQFKLESVSRLLNESQLAQLPQARAQTLARLGLSRHRASSDALVLQQAVLQLTKAAASV